MSKVMTSRIKGFVAAEILLLHQNEKFLTAQHLWEMKQFLKNNICNIFYFSRISSVLSVIKSCL